MEATHEMRTRRTNVTDTTYDELFWFACTPTSGGVWIRRHARSGAVILDALYDFEVALDETITFRLNRTFFSMTKDERDRYETRNWDLLEEQDQQVLKRDLLREVGEERRWHNRLRRWWWWFCLKRGWQT
jgi:hypothetical protein